MQMPNFKELGLKCDPGATTILGSLTYEYPVNLTRRNVIIGDCALGGFSYINDGGRFSHTSIGRYCSIAEEVVCGPGQHNHSFFSTHPFIYDPNGASSGLDEYQAFNEISGHHPPTPIAVPRSVTTNTVVIGNDVWIGMRSLIMSGVSVGDGAVIAAGAIVTKDVEPYTIVGGVPAKPIGKRFDEETIRQLMELRWWQYDMGKVSPHVNYGNPGEVIQFMKEGLKAGRIPRLQLPRLRVSRKGERHEFTQLQPL